MPEEYDPTMNAYEEAAELTIDLSPVDITEDEIDSALQALHDG
ncbi:hypothetical protein [Halorubrum tebenquichense]|nr:hypothetical protein [Halorubrum tebenquichense]